MKKTILFIWLILLFLFISCGKTNDVIPTPESFDFEFTNTDFEMVLYEDAERDFMLDLSNNVKVKEIFSSLSYFIGNETVMPEDAKFVLAIGSNIITVCKDDSVWLNDGTTSTKNIIIDGEGFDYFDTLTSGDAKKVGSYNDSSQFVVYNSKNYVCKIEENDEFLESLNEVKIIKLSNPNDYTIGEVDYTISIDNSMIKIYGDFVSIGSDLYAVVDGDFGFLSELDYSYSTDGFLPWI